MANPAKMSGAAPKVKEVNTAFFGTKVEWIIDPTPIDYDGQKWLKCNDGTNIYYSTMEWIGKSLLDPNRMNRTMIV